MAIGIKNTAPAQRGNSLGRVVEWRRGLLTIWLAGSALFLARAIAGYFPHPLASLGLIAVGIVAIVVAMELRVLLRGSFRASVSVPQASSDWLGQFLPTLGVLLLAIGFSVAGAYATGLVLLWVMTTGEALFGAGGPWTWPLIQRLLGRDRPDRGTTILDHPRGTVKSETLPETMVPEKRIPALSEPAAPELDTEAEAELDEELPWLWQDATAVQELRYMTLPESGQCIAGSQRVTLTAAQQVATVHTVFHPPFDAVPTVTIEMQEPESVTIKAAQILPHGIRWELRAVQALEKPQQVQWAFSVSTEADPRG